MRFSADYGPEVALREFYSRQAQDYRRDDDQHVLSAEHRQLGQILGLICCSFARKVDVLDVGCGTGRYFHCLQNVHSLVGLDLSGEMLEQAVHPVCQEALDIEKRSMICTAVMESAFPPESFDFVYSIGMFGYGCELTAQVSAKFHRWLRPGGWLFFDTIDVSGFPFLHRCRKQLRTYLYPRLPQSLRRWLNRRAQGVPLFVVSRSRLVRLLNQADFSDIQIRSVPVELPCGHGRKFLCTARKLPSVLPEPAHERRTRRRHRKAAKCRSRFPDAK